jgi:hypothetical protein
MNPKGEAPSSREVAKYQAAIDTLEAQLLVELDPGLRLQIVKRIAEHHEAIAEHRRSILAVDKLLAAGAEREPDQVGPKGRVWAIKAHGLAAAEAAPPPAGKPTVLADGRTVPVIFSSTAGDEAKVLTGSGWQSVRITPQQRAVLRALIDAAGTPAGRLPLAKLKKVSGGARGVLGRLRKHHVIGQVITPPGPRGSGYGLLFRGGHQPVTG